MRWLTQRGILSLVAFGPVAEAAAHASNESAMLGLVQSPLAAVLIGFAAAAYALGRRRMGAARARKIIGPLRASCFWSGLAVLGIALVSPLDHLAAESFAAHMTQHLLLMLVAPPLLVWSRPGIALLWAVPLRTRRLVARQWSGRRALRSCLARLMHPAVVFALASAALWVWHIPALYDAALASETVHVAEHACFVLTSLAFWTLVTEPYGARRVGYAATFVLVCTFALQSTLLGAILTFADRPLYASYALGRAALGLTGLEDQQLAGLAMWVPASVVYLLAFIGLIAAAFTSAETKAARRKTPHSP